MKIEEKERRKKERKYNPHKKELMIIEALTVERALCYRYCMMNDIINNNNDSN
jgi:hypothetical protein